MHFAQVASTCKMLTLVLEENSFNSCPKQATQVNLTLRTPREALQNPLSLRSRHARGSFASELDAGCCPRSGLAQLGAL